MRLRIIGLRAQAGRLRRRARFVRRQLRPFLAETAEREPGMPMARRLRHVLDGYHPLEASWYEQAHGTARGFISNFERETSLTQLNGEHGYLLGNKLVFAHVMARLGIPHPAVFGFSHGPAWHWLGDGARRCADALAAGEPVVVKPTNGRKGASIEFLSESPALRPARTEDVIATAFVRQDAYAARIFPGALNTVRVLTVIPGGSPPAVVAAVHRFGSSATRGVDNFSAGGMVARVDLASGVLGRAVSIGDGNRLLWSAGHPETGEPIAEVAVPRWPEVTRLALRLCETLPFLRYVGWDIAVTAAGPVVIEGNAHPSLRFFQLYGSLLEEAPARRFFAEHLRRAGPPP